MAKTSKRTVGKIHRMVDGFLSERVTTDGGSWPEVSDRDMGALWELISAIVDAKFQRDCDGDSVINFYFINRNLYMPLPIFRPVKYLHKVNNLEELLDIIRIRQGEMRYAAEQVDHALRYLSNAHEAMAKQGLAPDQYLASRHR